MLTSCFYLKRCKTTFFYFNDSRVSHLLYQSPNDGHFVLSHFSVALSLLKQRACWYPPPTPHHFVTVFLWSFLHMRSLGWIRCAIIIWYGLMKVPSRKAVSILTYIKSFGKCQFSFSFADEGVQSVTPIIHDLLIILHWSHLRDGGCKIGVQTLLFIPEGRR